MVRPCQAFQVMVRSAGGRVLMMRVWPESCAPAGGGRREDEAAGTRGLEGGRTREPDGCHPPGQSQSRW